MKILVVKDIMVPFLRYWDAKRAACLFPRVDLLRQVFILFHLVNS